MITSFGVVSLVVFGVCIVGMVLHFQVMRRRSKLDDLLAADEDEKTDTQALGFAIAEYNTYIARFPGIIMAKMLGFTPHE
ncbi:MAG: LemA family protein [Defluviitaleaceae bacterium]|nr:LemA family protein [Defluviitaleaceae bacterium]MCL2275113.1 LemA family protein [Defluviitaleaceae bacterium]